jgi:hypothetical protein
VPELVERCFLGTLTENSEHKHTQSTSTLWKGARGLYKGEVWTGAGEAGQRGSWEHVQSLQASSSSAPSTERLVGSLGLQVLRAYKKTAVQFPRPTLHH